MRKSSGIAVLGIAVNGAGHALGTLDGAVIIHVHVNLKNNANVNHQKVYETFLHENLLKMNK